MFVDHRTDSKGVTRELLCDSDGELRLEPAVALADSCTVLSPSPALAVLLSEIGASRLKQPRDRLWKIINLLEGQKKGLF